MAKKQEHKKGEIKEPVANCDQFKEVVTNCDHLSLICLYECKKNLDEYLEIQERLYSFAAVKTRIPHNLLSYTGFLFSPVTLPEHRRGRRSQIKRESLGKSGKNQKKQE